MAMRKDTFLFISGFLVFLTPFFGVPSSWKDVYLFVLGFLIAVVAFLCRLDVRKHNCNEEDISHIENAPMYVDDEIDVGA
jgi:hypothetical protein